MKTTTFWDMNSGGGHKEKFTMAVIEAPVDEAKSVFFARFGHNPERVSCTCCGQDYSIDEHESVDEAINNYVEGDYVSRDEMHVIYAGEIMPHERTLDVPKQGYVWCE